jgi:hypothetical protein
MTQLFMDGPLVAHANGRRVAGVGVTTVWSRALFNHLSARLSNMSGKVGPSALAAFRLIDDRLRPDKEIGLHGITNRRRGARPASAKATSILRSLFMRIIKPVRQADFSCYASFMDISGSLLG